MLYWFSVLQRQLLQLHFYMTLQYSYPLSAFELLHEARPPFVTQRTIDI